MSTTALDKHIEKELKDCPDGLIGRARALITRAWNAGHSYSEPHQGYRNYETFALGILLESDADLQKLWLDRAKEILATAQKDQDFTKREQAELNLADQLKEYYDLRGDYLSSPHLEWFRAGYEAVDWLELSRDLLDKLEGNI